jgi:hypothetical protein
MDSQIVMTAVRPMSSAARRSQGHARGNRVAADSLVRETEI